MDPNKIARDNHKFYYIDVGFGMCSHDFQIVLNTATIDKTALFYLGEGYIQINCTDIKNEDELYTLRHKVAISLLSQVTQKISQSIGGELNSEVEITTMDNFVFSFKITMYERDSAHCYEMVTDLTDIPEDEELGRFVELHISTNQ